MIQYVSILPDFWYHAAHYWGITNGLWTRKISTFCPSPYHPALSGIIRAFNATMTQSLCVCVRARASVCTHGPVPWLLVQDNESHLICDRWFVYNSISKKTLSDNYNKSNTFQKSEIFQNFKCLMGVSYWGNLGHFLVNAVSESALTTMQS